MLSIRTLFGVDYYTRAADESFSYYGAENPAALESDPPGVWKGKLAESFFGNSRQVDRKDFAALFFGFHPHTGEALTKSADRLGYEIWQAEEQLARPGLGDEEKREAKARLQVLKPQLHERDLSGSHRNHRPGIDLTFSPPKDFSLLIAAADAEERKSLLAAWRRSVEATLKTAEARYAKTRLRDGNGKLVKETITGSAIAMFEHIAARPVGDEPPDPDAHMHCVLFSPVHCQDSETRALFSNDLRLNLKVLDAEARARLAQELSRMGYGLVEDRQKNCTSFHLAGIQPEERERFSKRRGEILAAMASGQYRTTAVAAIGTRQDKGEWSRADALGAWKAEFAKVGLSVLRLKRVAAENEPRARSDEEILDQLLSMKSYFSARELREALWAEAQFATVPEGCDIGQWIDARLNRLLKSPDLLEARLPDGSTASRQRTAIGDDEPVFTTRSLLLRELKLDQAVEELGKRQGHRIDWPEVRAMVESLEAEKTEEAKAEAIARGKPLPDDFCWSYRDDQKAAIAKVLAGPDISYLQAMAGSGKTTVAAAMIHAYRARGMKVVALAPSNKAAGQLSEDCGLEGESKALTVDAFLLSKAKDQFDGNTVIFVDESSMVSFDHAEALVNLVRERGGKICFQGDKDQLPSVARGRFFANCLEKCLGTDAAELTVITRQREDWAKVATEAAARGDFARTLALLDEHGAVHTEGTDAAVLDRLARDYLADPQPAQQKLIVASRNADVAALNRRIRAALVQSGTVAEGLPCRVGKERKRQIAIGAGDRLVFTDTLREGRRKIAANGALGTVQSVMASENGLRIRVLLDGERIPVEVDTGQFPFLDHSFSISIHKSQGATVSSNYFYVSEFISSELAYVAMSRHRDKFGLYCREDQKQELAKWMGRRIEKLDASHLVSLENLNESAAELRKRDESFAVAIRKFIHERLPRIFKRLPESGAPMPFPAFNLPPAATLWLERLRQHQERLSARLAAIAGNTASQAGDVPASAGNEAAIPSAPPRITQERKRPRFR